MPAASAMVMEIALDDAADGIAPIVGRAPALFDVNRNTMTPAGWLAKYSTISAGNVHRIIFGRKAR